MNKVIKSVFSLFVVFFTALLIYNDMTTISPLPEQPVTDKSYIDVNGNVVSLDEFQGNYMWVDYAAEWCSYCEPQTRTIKALEKKMGDQLLFLTVVTGTQKVMESPTADTARQWANRFNLHSDMVLARSFTNKLPYHLFYSPSGKILYQGSGLYSKSKIRSIINKHMTD